MLRRYGTRSGRVALLFLCVTIWALPAVPAGAITALDWAAIDLIKGDPYPNAALFTRNSNFVTTPVTGSLVIGALTGQVFFNSETNLYTYLYTVDPQGTHDITEFNTGFAVSGFNNVGGYSWDDAHAAGAAIGSQAILFTQDPDNTLDWNVRTKTLLAGFWNSDVQLVPIRFFFQSTLPPGSGSLGINAGYAANTDNFAPSAVPEPSSLVLLSFGLIGLGGLARWKSKTTR